MRLEAVDTGDTRLVTDLTTWSRDELRHVGTRPGAAVLVGEVVGRHPVLEDPARDRVLVDVFTTEDPSVAGFRDEGFAVLERGLTEFATSAPTGEGAVDALLQTAFGADRVSATLRATVLGKADRLRRPIGPAPRDLPLIDDEKLQRVVLWGTLRDLIRAFQRLGSSTGQYAAWASRARAHANGITGLSPARGCGGQRVSIRGSGFGAAPPAHITVRFPTGFERCANAQVVSWSDGEIVAVAPADVGIGCVGFTVTDGPPPSDPVGDAVEAQAAAGMFQSVLGDLYGPHGVMLGQRVVGVAMGAKVPSLPCPPCLPADANGEVANRFAGGPPVIRSFTVDGGRAVHVEPGATPTLSWVVDNADTVRIVGRKAPASKWPANLPPVAGPLPPSGTLQLPALDPEAVDDWDGEYVLEATNACNQGAPATIAVEVQLRERSPLFGLADTHVHFMAHLGFAGHGIFGRPHASDPALDPDAALAEALPWCDAAGAHGPGGILPSLEFGLLGHLVGGHPAFDGWPRHTTLAHQQCYIDWIRRAVDGGLRLAVMHAVNSELLATRMTEIFGPGLAIDDMAAVNRQLDAIRAMVAFVDAQSGGPGQGWMQIAETPADARRIVGEGKLALILGIEVDSLGGWHTPQELEDAAAAAGKTPADLIRELLDDLQGKGVRHLFPVHGTNNAFAGTALFVRNYDAANYVLTGSSFETETADPASGIIYRVDADVFEGGGAAEVLGYHGLDAAKGILGGTLLGLTLGGLIGGTPGAIGGAAAGAATASSQYPCPPKPTNWAATRGGHINKQGLTGHGRTLVDEMMRRGMLIDVDHMGEKTFNDTLTMCEAQGYPVVAGHTSFRAVKYGWGSGLELSPETVETIGTKNARACPHEADKSPQQVERIRRLGGLVSVFAYQRDVLDCACGFGVRNDCAGASPSFAQAYLHAYTLMHGRRLALGTDVNGAGQLPGPRFGPQAAAALVGEADRAVREQRSLPGRRQQVAAQTGGVRYASPVVDYRHHRFMDYSSDPYMAPFDAEERDFWEAIAMWRSGTAPETAEQPTDLQRPAPTKNFIVNLATGLRAASRAEIPIAIPWNRWAMPWPFYFDDDTVQLAAHLAARGEDARATDPQRTRELAPKLGRVFAHWRQMEDGTATQGTEPWRQRRLGPAGSGLYDGRGSLRRPTAGRRDFDVNMDGMAHYGLLPDFLQDVANVGVPDSALDGLYRSAEDYIRTWETCLRHRPR
jgi:microsomal dipeptidase-like Zn-dependent dipeptidase